MKQRQADALIKIARDISMALADQKYGEIIESLSKSRLTLNDIRDVIEDYGKPLVYPPRGWEKKVDIVEIETTTVSGWSIIFPLWTQEEGESDLSVDITCFLDGNDGFKTELNDIHAL